MISHLLMKYLYLHFLGNIKEELALEILQSSEVEKYNLNPYFLSGLIFHLEKNYPLAIKFYLAAVEDGDMTGHEYLFCLYNEFIETIEKRMESSSEKTKSIFEASKKEYFELSQFHIERAISKQSGRALSLYAYFKMKQENYEEARKCLFQAIDLNYYPAHYRLARIYHFIDENLSKAYEHYTIGFANIINTSLCTFALCCLSLGKKEEAIKLFKLDIELNDSIDSAIELGDLYFEDKKYDLSIKYWELVDHHKDKSVITKLGDLFFFQLNDMKKAVSYYEKDLTDRYHIGKLIVIYGQNLKDYNKALKYANLLTNFNEADGFGMIGETHYAFKQVDLAMEFYQKSVDKGSIISLLGLSSCLIDKKLYKESLKCCQDFSQKVKDKEIENCVYYNLGRTYNGLNQNVLALDNYLLYLKHRSYGKELAVEGIVEVIKNNIDIDISKILDPLVITEVHTLLLKSLVPILLKNVERYQDILIKIISSGLVEPTLVQKILNQSKKNLDRFLTILSMKERESFNNECYICYEACNNKCITLNCKHQFCFTCLKQHFKLHDWCPVCKNFIC